MREDLPTADASDDCLAERAQMCSGSGVRSERDKWTALHQPAGFLLFLFFILFFAYAPSSRTLAVISHQLVSTPHLSRVACGRHISHRP